MHRHFAVALSHRVCWAVVASLIWMQAAGSAPVPVAADFGRVPAVDAVVLSPDGNQVAWIDNYSPTPQVVVFDLAAAAVKRRVTLPADMKLRDLDWTDDKTLLIDVSVTHSYTGLKRDQLEWFRTLALNVADGKIQMLLQRSGDLSYVTGSRILALRTAKPKTIIMSSWDFATTEYEQETGSRLAGGRKDAGWVYSLFEVSTATGRGSRLQEGTPYTDAWIVDSSGQAVVRGEWEAHRKLYRVLHRRGQGWFEIYRQEDGEDPSLVGLTQDGSALLMRGALGRQHSAIWQLSLEGGAPQVLLDDPVYDMTAVVLDPYSWQPIGAWVGGPNPEVRWFDPQSQARVQSLEKTFAGKSVMVAGRSADHSRVLAWVGTHATPTIYYLVDYKKGTADIVGEEYPALADKTLGEVRDLTYKARDGQVIPAYLTLPPAVEPKLLPLVVLPHGGPESRDARRFDWMAQFLATRGYAVLQPQFRGSTGYGEAFRKAGYRQWGGLMQDDVTDGVKALIEQGLADPARICIAGASYGGYAALAGAAFTPELYACAVSINGVSDLPLMLGYETRMGGDESDSLLYWRDHIGTPTDPNVIAKSPARAAASVRSPVLLMHGLDDTVVPMRQSQAMAAALKQHSRPHTFIELPGEDHWLSGSDSRIRVLTEMEEFLAANLAAGGPSRPVAGTVAANAGEIVCRIEQPTGTRLKREVCRQRDAAQSSAEESRQMLDKISRRNVVPPSNPSGVRRD